MVLISGSTILTVMEKEYEFFIDHFLVDFFYLIQLNNSIRVNFAIALYWLAFNMIKHLGKMVHVWVKIHKIQILPTKLKFDEFLLFFDIF